MDEELRDVELLKGIARGNESDFSSLYRRYETRLYSFIKIRLNDDFEAADILHELFMDVWVKADKFQGRSKVSTWLFGIAFNKTMDRLRKKKSDLVDDEFFDSIPADTPESIVCLINKESEGHVHYCLEKLKPALRCVMELTFFESLSYKAISAIVDCPENTVKTRVFHAKKVMKNCLNRRMGEQV